MLNRREFVKLASLGVAAAALQTRELLGRRLREIGIQLYTVREDCARDLAGTLNRLHTIGYQIVEPYCFDKKFQFFGKSASELHEALSRANFTAPSAHLIVLTEPQSWPRAIDTAHALRTEYLVVWVFDDLFSSVVGIDSLADQLNKFGDMCSRNGLRLAYHNHNAEFRKFGDETGFDRLLHRTDPQLVWFEMDCYWVVQAGHDPVQLLNSAPGRFPLLHIKDRPAGTPVSLDEGGRSVEVGKGAINWTDIFRIGSRNGLAHYYVEQEEFSRPPMESVAISYKYLRNLKI